jgi:hypothetical protein
MKYAQMNVLLHQQRVDAQERRQLEEHINRIKQEQPKIYNSAGEPLVVPSSALAPVLNRWKDIYELEHDFEYLQAENINKEDKPDVFGPMQYLHFHSGVPIRRIFGIMRLETKHTSLGIAEKLLSAIDREYMLKNGEIPVVPNPHWRMETWVAYMNKRGCSSDL